MHPFTKPMHGPACPSSQTPIRSHLTYTERDYMIRLLHKVQSRPCVMTVVHNNVFLTNSAICNNRKIRRFILTPSRGALTQVFYGLIQINFMFFSILILMRRLIEKILLLPMKLLLDSSCCVESDHLGRVPFTLF